MAEAPALAARLASVFPKTGLWPVLWDSPNEEPDAYVNVSGRGGVARADHLDARVLLRRGWKRLGFAQERRWPGRAAAAAEFDRMSVVPFGDITELSLLEQSPALGRVVMLVPVNRPADVLSVLRPGTTEYWGDHAMTAILRSWEERFGAVVAALSPGGLELAVGAPPSTADQALRLAAEHAVFAPEDDGTSDFQTHAQRLMSSRLIPGETAARYWLFGWPD